MGIRADESSGHEGLMEFVREQNGLLAGVVEEHHLGRHRADRLVLAENSADPPTPGPGEFMEKTPYRQLVVQPGKLVVLRVDASDDEAKLADSIPILCREPRFVDRDNAASLGHLHVPSVVDDAGRVSIGVADVVGHDR